MYLKTVVLIILYVSLSNHAFSQELTRGPDCYKGDYPTKVNLQFEEISLHVVLKLLADFSCNEIDIKKSIVNPKIATYYKEEPWERVVREICLKNNIMILDKYVNYEIR